jgi:hypothetical protein
MGTAKKMKMSQAYVDYLLASIPNCTICDSPNVYFEEHTFTEEEPKHSDDGSIMVSYNEMIKRYCKKCFKEYGGK